ncbi:MAG: rhodanese-like domain-containing protein [Caulobacterales bacterium]|nr:rhodanese-like domain-containing protein [Caulobacterales bacterium]
MTRSSHAPHQNLTMTPLSDERWPGTTDVWKAVAAHVALPIGPRVIMLVVAAIVIATSGYGDAALAGDWRYMLSPPQTLAQVEREVAARYRDVGQITVGELATLRSRQTPLLLVDVREADEFAVSRLSGAVRIDPDTSVSDAGSMLSGSARGRVVVLYCSVGQRSSAMARRIQGMLIERGALNVLNLRGGIFAWHNAGLPLANASGATRYVHPFSGQWRSLLIHPDLASPTPLQAP